MALCVPVCPLLDIRSLFPFFYEGLRYSPTRPWGLSPILVCGWVGGWGAVTLSHLGDPHCTSRAHLDLLTPPCVPTQVSALRQELRKRDLGQVSVCSFEILPGG